MVGTAFAVLLAFVIFVAFQSYDSARTQAQKEADAVQKLYATTHFLSPPTRDELQGQLICYSRAVIHEEWPAMRQQRSSPDVDGWVARLDQSIFQFEPVEEQDKAALSQWLDKDGVRREHAGSIKPVDMTRTLELMNADQKAAGENVHVPCDARGQATESR